LHGGLEGWAAVFEGSVQHKFNIWIPDARDEEKAPLIRLIEKRYAGQGRGYVSGEVSEFVGNPQIVLSDIEQLADSPPGPRDG
jgi:micrococcal nuclease